MGTEMSWYLKRRIHDKMYLSIDQQTFCLNLFLVRVVHVQRTVHTKRRNILVFFNKFHGVVKNDHGLMDSIKLLLVTVLLFWI